MWTTTDGSNGYPVDLIFGWINLSDLQMSLCFLKLAEKLEGTNEAFYEEVDIHFVLFR